LSNKNSNYTQKHYDELLNELTKNYPEQQIPVPSEIIKKIKVLEAYTLDKNRFFCLFSQASFFPIYISKNVKDISGYTAHEIHQKGLLTVLKMLHWKHLPMAIKVHRWGSRFQQIVGNEVPLIGREVFFCGFKAKTKAGILKTFFAKQKILTAKNYKPILSFLEIEDITPLFKADFVWGRLTAQHEDQFHVRVFFQVGKKTEYEDLLSARELEILKLAMKQKSNIEISELLEISKNTVERHRKNMIARVGVTDMTALIYICKLCKLI